MTKKLFRLIAILLACLGVFVFAACNNHGGAGEGTGTGQGEGGPEDGDPEITGPVEGGPTITKWSTDELETAYVEWTAADNAKWYNVYCSANGKNEWTKIDAPLVRQYSDYFRADVLGLKKGSYDIKVVPVSAEGNEATEYAATKNEITVAEHDRSGYAFLNGSSSGAYNDDGTLKAGANVIYVTDANKDTVSLEMNAATVTGLQNILDAQKTAGKPLAVRFIGKVTSPSISGSSNKDENTLLLKADKKPWPDLSVTLEGVGNDATAYGWQLRLTKVYDVELRNMGFMLTKSGEGDGVTLEGDDHVWVHNCDFFYGEKGSAADQIKGDGALDTKTSTNITHSYNHFWDSGKCNLQGMKEESSTNCITYHHNWYDHSDSRHPRIRTVTVHIYNNYFDGNAKYGVGVTLGANAFVEGNYFRSTSTLKPMLSSMQGTDATGSKGTFSSENGGMIKSYGNEYKCTQSNLKLITQKDTAEKDNIDCYEAESRNEQVSDDYVTKQGGTKYSNFDTAADFYEYTAQSAEDAKTTVERYAGRVGGGDFKWEFDDAKEDANSDIIEELKTALTAYTSGLIKVDGEKIESGTGSGSTGGGSGNTGTGGPIDLTGITVIIFDGDPKDINGNKIDGVTVSGSYTNKGTFDFNGATYHNCLKMEGATLITIEFDKKVKLNFYTSASGKIIVNGTKYTVGTPVTVEAGVCEIAKGDTMYLYYMTIEVLDS